ncbi:MAG: LamG domain-containing protein, partial [Burkholderiales bacterium]
MSGFPTALSPQRTLTLETWIKVDSFDNAWMPVVQKATGSGVGTRSYSLWVNSSGYLHFTSSDGVIQDYVNTPAGSIKAGQWVHFAGVMDRNSGRLEVYLDGELVGWGAARTTNAIAHTGALLFGRTFESSASYAPFNG